MLARGDVGRLLVLTLLWGLNWPMMKYSLRELSPLWFRAITMSGGTLALLAFFAWRGQDMRLPRAEWGRLLWLALPNIVGWHLFSILGLKELASGRAAILGFTMPVWTLLVGVLLAGDRLTPRAALAAVAACAAVALLSWQELAQLAGRPIGVLWMQLGAISWACGTVLMRRSRTALSTEGVTVGMMAIGSLCFWGLAPLLEPLPQPANFSAGMWGSLAYGVFLNFGTAQVLWFGMARRLPPAASAFSIMAVPVVGTLAATVIVGEVPRLADGLAAACVVVAIAASVLPARRTGHNPQP